MGDFQTETRFEPGLIQGVGLGLRTPHYSTIENNKPNVAWFEALIDNYIAPGGIPLLHLERIRQDYAVTFHSVGMSLGSTDPLNWQYLKQLKQRIQQFSPAWISDHLCWTSVGGRYSHELMPMPYTDEAIRLLISRIQQVQDFLQQRILIENVSSYLRYAASAMQEWDFLSAIASEADCDILLDINNIYVSACNHGIDADKYLSSVPTERVREMHLAGYEDMGTHLLDTHGEPVHDAVWELYYQALLRFGPIPTLVEWDNNIPAFSRLLAEGEKAKSMMRRVCDEVA
jgi:uncharacterized protein (UPF0276 family)